MKISIVVILGFLTASTVEAKLQSFDHSLSDSVLASRWIYEPAPKSPGKGIIDRLYNIKKAQVDGKWSLCYQQGESALAKAPGLKNWIHKVQLECLNEWGRVARQARKHLRKVLFTIERSGALDQDVSRKVLLKPFLKSQFLILGKDVDAGSRVSAWKRVEKIQAWESHLSHEDLGELYFRAGELAFVEQKLMGAYNFFLRSQRYTKRPEIEDKLAIIRKTLPQMKQDSETLKAGDSTVTDATLKFSEEENKLVERMRQSLDSKDLVSAVEDGVRIINKFPGSENAEWAEDKILGVYLGLVGQSDRRYELFRKKILRFMKDADAKRLKRWAVNAWSRGAFDDAVLISEMALDKLSPHPDERKILILAANSAVSAGKYSVAEEHYKTLANGHGGTAQAQEALFRLGLLFFRKQNYSQSAFYMEKLLATELDSDFHSKAMYWRWRAYQKLDRKEVNEAAELLMTRYPLTYYGLRARAEMNNGQLLWKVEASKEGATNAGSFMPSSNLRVSLTLTQFETQAWERFRILLQAGWLEEAQEEFKNLPVSVSPEQKVISAKFMAKAMNHFGSISTLNEVWNSHPELQTLETVSLAFPFEFEMQIQEQAKRYNISPHLIRGLIRQESSFRPRAVSPSNAYGLMQIVPITAKDIARFLKWKKPLRLPEDMFDVDQNIRFGASYLSRMINAFDGHVPLALAAYNAGIGRMRRWINQRPDLGVDEKNLDSSPESEIWIDELPWKETRHYVKAVIRNYLIYQMISEGKVTLDNPVWKIPTNKVSSR